MGEVSLQASDEFEAMLCDVIGAAQRDWPQIGLPADVFAVYLRARLPPDIPPSVGLRQIQVADLYLACACAHGDPNALVEFDHHCLAQLDRALGKIGIAADVIAEIKQEIRCRVLAGENGRAEILDFMGRGDLRGWVRVMATRRVLHRQRSARREVAADDDALLQQMILPADPELDYMKMLYRREFEQAFETAMRALPDREQTLLCQHYIDGSTLDELAVLYHVHRATAARALARARVHVLEATRDRLMSQLGVRSQDLDSILRMIWSRIEVSLRGFRRGRRR